MEDFMKIACKLGKYLADKSHGLTGTDHRVLWTLISESNYGGVVKTPQKKLAKELRLQQTYVSIAIKRLEKLNVLTKKRNRFNQLEYHFNPDLIMKGNIKKQKSQRKLHVILGGEV